MTRPRNTRGGSVSLSIQPTLQKLLLNLEDAGKSKELILVKSQTMLSFCGASSCPEAYVPSVSGTGYKTYKFSKAKTNKVLNLRDVLKYITHLDPATGRSLPARTWRIYDMVDTRKGVMSGEEVVIPFTGEAWASPTPVVDKIVMSLHDNIGTYKVRMLTDNVGDTNTQPRPKFFIPKPPEFPRPKELPTMRRNGVPRVKLISSLTDVEPEKPKQLAVSPISPPEPVVVSPVSPDLPPSDPPPVQCRICKNCFRDEAALAKHFATKFVSREGMVPCIV